MEEIEKRFSWGLSMVLRSWGFKIGLCRQTIEPLGQRMEFSVIELSFLPLQRVPTSDDELKSKTPRDVPNVGGGFSIV